MPSTVEVTTAPTPPSPEEEDETRREESLSDDSTTDEETQDIEPPPVITAGIKICYYVYGPALIYTKTNISVPYTYMCYRRGMLFRNVCARLIIAMMV